jgi:hypothetical protein
VSGEIQKETEQAKKPEKTTGAEKTAESQKDNTALGCLLALIIIFVTIVLLVAVIVSIIPQEISPDDYTVNCTQGVTSYSVEIIPTRNIDNCYVEIILYDRYGDELYSETISKTNLKKGIPYTYKFEYGVINSLSGYEVKCNITGTR